MSALGELSREGKFTLRIVADVCNCSVMDGGASKLLEFIAQVVHELNGQPIETASYEAYREFVWEPILQFTPDRGSQEKLLVLVLLGTVREYGTMQNS